MMKQPKKVGLLTGGYTSEYEVSIKSAKNVVEKLHPGRFETYVIYITPEEWYYQPVDGQRIRVNKEDFSIQLNGQQITFDVIFICIHGSPGEDGKLQAYFDLLRIPYTSCKQLASAITMNKFYTKAVLSDLAELHIAPSVLLVDALTAQHVLEEASLIYPLFVKPNNGGSSIGLSKITAPDQIDEALRKAFQEDPGNQVIAEEFIAGRELSVGVFRFTDEITVLPPSEVVLQADYFDFQTKYNSPGTIDITPADLTDDESSRIQRVAKHIFTRLGCKGVVRIDFILQHETGLLHLLEINTIPGQTDSSFVPKQLRAAGIDVSHFFSQLIDEALI